MVTLILGGRSLRLLVSDHRAIAKLDLQSELGWIGPQLQKGATQHPLSATREAAYEYPVTPPSPAGGLPQICK